MIAFLICIVWLIYRAENIYRNYLDRKTDIEEMKGLIEFDYDKTKNGIGEFLNRFVTDAMQDYAMYHIVPDTGLSYIDKEKENQIRSDLTEMISKRLSPSIRKKIELCYSDEYFADVMAEKIFFIVTIYVADYNENTGKRSGDNVIDFKRKVKEKLAEEEFEPTEDDW